MTAPGTLVLYAGAALAEITGCFAVWTWMRQGASALWLIPTLVSLATSVMSRGWRRSSRIRARVCQIWRATSAAWF